MEKRLCKSTTDVKISGVCGGIAAYFNIDPTLVRIAWVIFCVLGGSGILAYIICAIVMPSGFDNNMPPRNDYNQNNQNGPMQ